MNYSYSNYSLLDYAQLITQTTHYSLLNITAETRFMGRILALKLLTTQLPSTHYSNYLLINFSKLPTQTTAKWVVRFSSWVLITLVSSCKRAEGGCGARSPHDSQSLASFCPFLSMLHSPPLWNYAMEQLEFPKFWWCSICWHSWIYHSL